MRAHRLFGAGLFTLAALIIGYAVLGPLILDVIHVRALVSGLNQVRGGDLAALVVVAPTCVGVGVLDWRGDRTQRQTSQDTGWNHTRKSHATSTV